MTLSITHTTPADGTFSATGAAAWDATHTVAGVGTMAEQDANAVAITGGAISNTSMTVLDNAFTLQDNLDTSKQAQFQLSSLTTGTTFSYVLPLGNGSASNLVDQQSTQTITGIKTFSGGVTFSAASGSYGTNANASTYNYASGATTTGNTKTVNFGTGGVSGSTTNITIGTNVSGSTSTTTMNGVTKRQVYTVATLPSASTSGIGATAFVSDALAPAFGATVVTGGAIAVPVYSDGTNWKVG